MTFIKTNRIYGFLNIFQDNETKLYLVMGLTVHIRDFNTSQCAYIEVNIKFNSFYHNLVF